MQLREFLMKELPDTAARKDFAKSVGTTWEYLQHVMNERRRPSGTLAVNIERESNRAVTCEEMCPETDWQYIRNSDQPAA